MPTNSLVITDNAYSQLDNVYNKHNVYIRIEISSGGCQGFNKTIKAETSISDDDIVFSSINDCGKLIIDPFSLDLINGAIVDYKNDPSGAFFDINISAATSTCGCGMSFNLA